MARSLSFIQTVADTNVAGVKPEQMYCDGWSIGIDQRFPQSQRLQQCIVGLPLVGVVPFSLTPA